MHKAIPAIAALTGSMTLTFFAYSQSAEPVSKRAGTTEIEKLRQQVRTLRARQAREDANKKLVLDFYQQFFGDKDISAADRYLLPSYIQHNPYAATGREAVKRFFKPYFSNPAIPKTKVDVKRVAADGDLVWLHIRSKTTGSERAVVDIFRIQNGKIAEHWDVVQPVPTKSANKNTMF
jgi:predicted SnoaL-like aldol condensation-catalyzing enzyme